MSERNGGIIEPGNFPLMNDGDGPAALYMPKDMHIRPHIPTITVKVTAEMTPEGKQIIRTMVAEVLKEALADERVIIPFANVDALREFIRVEVRTAIEETYLHE